MMLSTSPSLPEQRKMPVSPGVQHSGKFITQGGGAKLGFLRNRQLLKGSALQLDEDSTDIGSAMSSDAEMPHSSSFGSPSCSDNEVAVKSDSSSQRKQRRTIGAFLKPSSRRGNFKSTPLETIQGTPAGMSEHPPLFFPPGPIVSSTESAVCTEDDPTSPTAVPKPAGFVAPPGLASPTKSRKSKTTTARPLLATVPKVSSPRRSRKLKTAAVQSFLATGPENLLNQAHVLPPSPTRRARTAIIDKANMDGAPLKVQMAGHNESAASGFVKRLLDPTLPVKKKPILFDSDQCLHKLRPGEPAKKHVTPWLLADPLVAFTAMPR